RALYLAKANLKTYQLIKAAKKRHDELFDTLVERRRIPKEIVSRILKNRTAHPYIPSGFITEENVAAVVAMLEEVRREIGDQNVQLAKIADDATIDNLQNELALIDRLDYIGEREAELGTVAQQRPEQRLIARRGDDQNVAYAGEHQRRQRIIDHRLVVDRQ